MITFTIIIHRLTFILGITIPISSNIIIITIIIRILHIMVHMTNKNATIPEPTSFEIKLSVL